MNRTCLVLVIVAMSSATFLAPQICIAQQRQKPKSCWDTAQKAWEAYRDSQLEAIYPREGTPGYGSVFPMCFAILKTDLTEGRIRDLKALTTSGEGDVCYGLRPVAARRNNQLSSTPVNYSRTEIHRRVSGGRSAPREGN